MTPLWLFSNGRLRDKLEMLGRSASSELLGWDADELLALPEADVIDHLIDVATIVCPALDRNSAYMLDPHEVDHQFYDFGQPFTRRVTRFDLVVPFDGNREVFTLQASTFSTSQPEAEVRDGQLRIYAFPNGQDAAAIKANFDGQLDRIEQQLTWSRSDIEAHQRQIETDVPRLVRDRRAKLLADRDLHANIGFPIKPRDDASTFRIPFQRRTVTPRKPTLSAAARFTPEPALGQADYENALAVLQNMRNALERSPSTTHHLGEEQIRDLLLVSLNAQFEGKAAGEVFNGSGKTDILIRVEDRNIFIGECKIWKGPKTVTDALDQLLSYLVWRDTKAALLLFIRDSDVSTITAKAVAQVELHSNYKRRGSTAAEDRYDFVFHANGDTTREIHLALLPFLIAGKSRPATQM
ncbi:hypothetical protein JK358_10255 [Nocardia sp. 2]|uniref:Restriction endonuclease n=2 Tax=Nocardia acididurans TaxID=2802282 RepID=A0ABS1M282_9NOCA|nr:hypothetical protein [Nocardia acididurans]